MSFGNIKLGRVRIEIARLGFKLVWLDLFWFRLFPCLKKQMTGEILAGKNNRGNGLAGKSPSGEKT